MGHKVHPIGFRIGVICDWQAKWYADKHYAEHLREDLKLRKAIDGRYADARVSRTEIERQANKVMITIYTARPGIVIGRGGQRVEETRLHLEQLIGKRVQLNIQEIRQPELNAHLVARTIAEQLEHRVAFRRAMKQVILRTRQAGALGIRVSCAGRLGGAEIARRLTFHEGQVPLHTLRADIDYGFVEAHTKTGQIGIKVWIYKGEVLPEPKVEEIEETAGEPVEEIASEATPAVKAEEKPAEPVKRRTRRTVTAASTPEPASDESEESSSEPVAQASTEAEQPLEQGEENVTT